MLMILLSTLKFVQTSDLYQHLELTAELESDLQDTVDWGRKWLANFNAGKAQDRSNNTGAIDVKMDGCVLGKKSSFNILGLSFSSKLDWGFTLSLLLKLPPRKLEP